MDKLSEKELEDIKKKLKPYWKEYQKLEGEFFSKINNLQKKMNK